MPSAAELKAKYEAEKAERQRREDEEKAKEADMLREIAEAEEAERKAAEKAEQERLEREKKLLEALVAKELADKRAAKERESALQTKTTGASRASSPVKTRVVVSAGDGVCWPCKTKGKACVFPS